jgi:hypothetical protein
MYVCSFPIVSILFDVQADEAKKHFKFSFSKKKETGQSEKLCTS